MSVGFRASRLIALSFCGLLCACSGSSGGSSDGSSGRAMPEPPVAKGAKPLVLQLLRTEAQMKRYPFRTLQPFEHPVDLMFLDSEGVEPELDGARGHTGTSSLRLSPGARSAVVKLPSLLSGLPWPDQWTLVGAYLYAAAPQRLTATYEVEGQAKLKATVELPAGRWTPVLLDLSSLDEASAASLGTLRYSFAEPLSQPLWVDNVHVINNAETLVPKKEGGTDAGPWRVSERGFVYTISYPAAGTTLKLVAPEADPRGWGWTLEEAGPTRVRFAGRGGEGKVRVIYADGRQYIDGQYKPPAAFADAQLARQHEAPGTIAVRPDLGRVNRTAAGDANNDGYCEQTGSYLLIAGGARLEFTLTPEPSVPLTRPLVEISGLPAGAMLADMDGRTVQALTRLENGVVLMELPGTIARAVTVNLRVVGDPAR